jgi:hypothetical protein
MHTWRDAACKHNRDDVWLFRVMCLMLPEKARRHMVDLCGLMRTKRGMI